jgi:hypothetical protein
MIIFANADGSIAAFSPSRITQGSVDANKIVLVGPFSNSIVTIAFTLPNGIVLGPNLAELPEEYTMTELNDGEAVHTGLYAYSYTMNKSLTSMSGTLGIQFFISTNRGTAENPTYTDTLATNMVNVTVYNGSRYIPPLEVPSSSDELTELLASIESALKNAIQIDSDGNAQYIYSDVDIKKKTGGDSTEGEGTEGEGTGGNLGVEGNLDVGGNSNLGLTAKVVNDDGDATITLNGATGTVTAGTVNITDGTNSSSINPQAASFAGDVGVTGNLDVDGTSTLGLSAQVVKADGTPSVTINGDTGTVTASTLVSSSGVISSILTVGSLISNSGVLAQLVQTPSISSGSSSTLDIQRKVIGILVNIAVNIFGSLKVTKVGQEGALTESITEIDGGNITASGNVSVGSVKTSTILPMDDSNVITLGAVPLDDPTAVDTVKVEGNLDVTGNLDVGGNLNLKGKPIAQNMETLLVKDNIIVTNSSGADFSLSGIVMRALPNSPKAYGILYSPVNKAVMIGEGELKEITDATTGAVTYEFNYYVGKSLPLAARSGFNNIKGGYIPVWDADKNAFVPSDKKAESLATQTWVETYVADYVATNGGGGGDTAAIAEQLHKINTGGIEE